MILLITPPSAGSQSPATTPCPSVGRKLHSVESVALGLLVERLGRLSDERMRQVCTALAVAVACEGGPSPTPRP